MSTTTIWSCAQTKTNVGQQFVTPLRPLLQALDTSRASGSIEFSGHCTGFPGDFQHLRVPSASGGSPLQIARETFSDDPSMQITQDSDGTVRIRENGVLTDLLKVTISHLSFEKNGVPLQYAAYSPEAALYRVILQTPEVVSFSKAHGIQIPFFGSAGIGGPGRGIPVDNPHISESMDNLTLSQALDRLARIFPGIWVYENCPVNDWTGRTVSFWFFSLQNPGFFPQ